MTADLIVRGRIATLRGDRGFGWVEAIAIGRGRVIAAGSLAEVQVVAGPATRELELGPGHVAIPGITDAHLHLVSAALAADELDVVSAPGLDGVLDAVRAAHRARVARGDRDGWLTGRGWSLDGLGAWPHADALERAAPGRPVVLGSYDAHGVWGSPAALRAAGIDRATTDPPGGLVLRDSSGDPTGVLLEAAVPLLERAVPVADDDAVASALAAYASHLTASGIVACHDLGESWAEPLRFVRLLARLDASGALPVRTVVSVRRHELEAATAAGMRSGATLAEAGAGRARFGWLKLFADGTLGSRTAAMLEPYCEEPGQAAAAAGTRGTLVTPPDELARSAHLAAEAGIATQIHAIGDRAVRVALDALLPVTHEVPLRPRLEHVQAIAPEDRSRAASLGVVASVQPIHLRADVPKARSAWADRLHRVYPLRSLAESGVPLAFGSDAPVEPADPWAGLALAVTRVAPDWSDAAPFVPGEALDIPTALRAACVGPPWSAGEHDAGRLLPGDRADLVVVPRTVLDGRALAAVRPVLTLVDGREAYRDARWEREATPGGS